MPSGSGGVSARGAANGLRGDCTRAVGRASPMSRRSPPRNTRLPSHVRMPSGNVQFSFPPSTSVLRSNVQSTDRWKEIDMSPSAMNVLSRTCVPRVMCSWIGRGTP